MPDTGEEYNATANEIDELLLRLPVATPPLALQPLLPSPQSALSFPSPQPSPSLPSPKPPSPKPMQPHPHPDPNTSKPSHALTGFVVFAVGSIGLLTWWGFTVRRRLDVAARHEPASRVHRACAFRPATKVVGSLYMGCAPVLIEDDSPADEPSSETPSVVATPVGSLYIHVGTL